MLLGYEIDKPTLRAVLTFVPEHNGRRATSTRYIWRIRRQFLVQLWWHRIARLPGGQAFIDRYERVVTDRWVAHLLGCHSLSACRGRRCPGPWTGSRPRLRGRWYQLERGDAA